MEGYWNLPKNTVQAFLPEHDSRWYRTGDIVVELPDGNYKFLGRRDRMIKKRGYRIELGEIEVALYRHPAIKEAAVLAFPDERRCTHQGVHKYARRIEVVDYRAKEILFRESAALYGSRLVSLPRFASEDFDRQDRLSEAQDPEEQCVPSADVKILVPTKRVPSTDERIRIQPDGSGIEDAAQDTSLIHLTPLRSKKLCTFASVVDQRWK